jgi:LacI family transcriptional regulator
VAATIYDIAKAARVGIGTISRAFNHHPNVSIETKENAFRVAGVMNYHPRPYSRGLARKKTNSILAVVPFLATPFFVEILHGIQAFYGESNQEVILQGVTHPERADQTLR